jgi:hypothetical protein
LLLIIVYLEDFRRAFQSTRPNNFSYEGLIALYDYFQNLEDDIGEELDLDVIAVCCDYSEYKNFQELKSNYLNIKTLEDLRERTEIIPIEDTEGFIVRNF